MRVIIFGNGTKGDVFPLIPIAKELVHRKIPVTFFSNEIYKDVISKNGIEFEAIGRAAHTSIYHNPEFWNPKNCSADVSLNGPYEYSLIKSFNIIRKYHEQGQKLFILSTGRDNGARIAADCFSLPRGVILLYPSLIQSCVSPSAPACWREPSWIPSFLSESYFKVMYFIAGIKFYYRKHQKILRKFKRKYNIRPLHYNFGSGYESEKLLLGIFPAWFAPRQQDWPKNLVLTDFLLFSDSNCSNDVNRFIAENEEYVVVMSGSMSSFSEHTTEVFLEFYRMRCIPIIFVGNFQETKIDGVIFVKNIDLGYLLKGAKMIVHQGGIGTTGHAINSGVPQIVLPHCFDQFDNAKRVRDLGVGDFILPSNLNISSFLPVFDSLLLRYKWSNLNEKYAGRTNSDAAVNRIVDMLILEHSA